MAKVVKYKARLVIEGEFTVPIDEYHVDDNKPSAAAIAQAEMKYMKQIESKYFNCKFCVRGEEQYEVTDVRIIEGANADASQ